MLNNLYEFTFDENTHTYTDTDGIIYTSSSTWVKQFDKKFDSDAMALKMSVEKGITIEEVKQEWLDKANLGTTTHAQLEYAFTNQPIDASYSGLYRAILSKIGTFDRAYCEQRFISKKLRLAGTVDLIIERNGRFEIFDFKTNNSLYKSYYDKLKAPYNHLPAGTLSLYQLQMSLYCELLEHNNNKCADIVTIIHIDPYTKEIRDYIRLNRQKIPSILT